MKKQIEELEGELESQKRLNREHADACEDALIKIQKLEVNSETSKKEIERFRFDQQEHHEKHQKLTQAYIALQESSARAASDQRRADQAKEDQQRKLQDDLEASLSELKSLAKRLKEKDRKVATLET